MYNKYVQLCADKEIDIGVLWIYKSQDKWILNFPTKMHWKYPSKKEYLYAGLEKFLDTYQEKSIHSIAFPLLGSDKGGIPQEESLKIMTSYLDKVDVNVNIEIYRYSATAEDDLYRRTKEWLLLQDIDSISRSTKLRKDYVVMVIDAMQSSDIFQLNQLAKVKGIGIKTLEKLFNLAQATLNCDTSPKFSQKTLF